MKCPLCLDTDLDVTHHAGIEVDVCPRCRGVWLDRGELERIASDARGTPPTPPVAPSPTGAPNSTEWEAPRPSDRSGKSKKKRKKRLSDRLGDVFEELIDL